MAYKMIVLDMDDTLLNDDLEISQKNKEALTIAQEKGITVVLCSGRPCFGMYKYAKELNLDLSGGYVIGFNGANIIDFKTNEVIYKNNLSKEDIHMLYDLSIKHNVGLHTYGFDKIIARQEYKYTKFESTLVGMDILTTGDKFKEIVDFDVTKAIFVEEPSVLNNVYDDIYKSVIDNMNITFSKPFFLEIMNKNVSKGYAITFLANKLNIDKSEIIAFGDSYNDISMLEASGTSVAMENGVLDVKNICDYITTSNNEDGVYNGLLKYGIIS